jgi:alpha-galactosidase
MKISLVPSTLTALATTLVVACSSAPVVVTPAPVAPASSAATAAHPNITGNWLAAVPNPNDGTFRRTYFNLTQDGDRVTGTAHSTQFYYQITDAKWDSAGGLMLTASMRDLGNERRVVYDVKIAGPDELRFSVHPRADRPPPAIPPAALVAHRAPAGEGAMPAKIAVPALHKVRDNGIARTPAMGWNSWNKFAGRVDDAAVRAMADAMASNGMREAGYVYVNIDDTWEGDQRDAQGNITTNRKFPDMKALADYVHSKGLKLGIYSSPGPTTCAGYEGSYGHEAQDARTFAAWGIDYLKYDWCGARMLHDERDMQGLYQIMGEALLASGRQILYSLCQYGRMEVWKWGADVGGNSWRTTGDIRDAWDSMTRIGFSQDSLAPYAQPGHFNDPDMLEIGNGGMTDTEYRTHMTLWSMLASPLLAGNDLRTMTPSILEILSNREVIAIDQDSAGKQARRAWASDDSAAVRKEIWTRPLAKGAYAVAAFNRGPSAAEVTIDFAALGVDPRGKTVRDLWAHRNVAVRGGRYTATVPSHGTVLLRVGR